MYHSTLGLRVIKKKKFGVWGGTGGLVFTFVSLNSRLESNKEEEEVRGWGGGLFPMSEVPPVGRRVWSLGRYRGGLVFKAHRRLSQSTLGVRVIKNKKKDEIWGGTSCGKLRRGEAGCCPERPAAFESQLPHRIVNLLFTITN